MLDASRQYEVLIRPLGRGAADEYWHNGSVWIEGREGSKYTIDLINRGTARACFVVSVDGLDVLEGKPAGLDSQGYIVNPGTTVSVPGWRLNDAQAAEFFFSRTKDSYVTQIGGTVTNTGVIGAMIFAEQPVLTYPSYYRQPILTYPNTTLTLNNMTWNSSYISTANLTANAVRSAAASIPVMSSQAVAESNSSQDVGTGFGHATDWHTNEAQFTKRNPSQPDALIAIYYNTAKNLQKMGIRLKTKHNPSYQANPFPAYASPSNGCPTPSGWRP